MRILKNDANAEVILQLKYAGSDQFAISVSVNWNQVGDNIVIEPTENQVNGED